MKKLAFALALACLASGCYTVRTAQSPILGPDVEGHVYIRDKAWNILGCVPLVSGNADLDSWCPIAFFRDDATLEIAKDKLVKLAAKRDCDVRDTTYIDDSRVLVSFFGFDIPWILQSKTIEVSALLVKKPVEVAPKAAAPVMKKEVAK